MTNPKIQTLQINGYRYYKHPNIPTLKAPSVTSIIDMLPAPFLRAWNSKVTANAAVDNIEYVNELIGAKQQDKARMWLKAAPERELKTAADIGDRVHKAIEERISNPLASYDDDLQPFIKNFDLFCVEFEPEWLHVEKSVFSVTHMYAGSFDAIAKIRDKITLVDFKTTRSGISAKVALQLAAYSRADVMFDDDIEIPMPKVDNAAALWLRPDQWGFFPLRIDDDIFETFLSLRRIFEWDSRQSKTAMLSPISYKERK
jgi:hypothetical protein